MSRANPTRAPRRPPFPVGTRLKYIGSRYITTQWGTDGDSCVVMAPGLVVEIDEAKLGRRGTGQQLCDHDGPMFYEDTGEPIVDETTDGRSCYHLVDPAGRAHGRIVDPREWEVVEHAASIDDLRRVGTRVEVSGMDAEKRKPGEAPRFYPGKVVHWTKSWLHIEMNNSGHTFAFTAADIKRHVRRAR